LFCLFYLSEIHFHISLPFHLTFIQSSSVIILSYIIVNGRRRGKGNGVVHDLWESFFCKQNVLGIAYFRSCVRIQKQLPKSIIHEAFSWRKKSSGISYSKVLWRCICCFQKLFSDSETASRIGLFWKSNFTFWNRLF